MRGAKGDLVSTESFALLSLPDEVTTQIIAVLSQIDILSLIQVNKHLYSLGLPKLYHSIYLNNSTSCTPLAISSEINYPFHIKYTIINWITFFIRQMENNPNKNLVKEIVTNCIEPDDFKTIQEMFPKVNITIEYDSELYRFRSLDLSMVNGLELTYENALFFDENIRGKNYYSIKEVGINEESDHDLFGIIPVLKGLESMHITSVSDRTFTSLKDAGVSKLAIKRLFLQNFITPNNPGDLFRDLDEYFNLESLETFGFDSKYDSLFQDLQLTIPRLSNLKHLFLHGNRKCCFDASMILPRDSLEFLCLHDSKENGEFFDYDSLMTIISRQESTLTSLCLQCNIYHYMGYEWVDRVYNYLHEVTEIDNRRNIHLINQILAKGTRFPKLDTIIINEKYYFIKRNGPGDIKINTI
ncbi:uncharacterized protein SPAPADRAFT_68946 [Spathaspora passalidarum NRRL Y-27907]|uniref:F-box domain-containing protein n=1 Tax=Spathaspora passalidarum (strain NRRL Y-27907 / 11-Y1) TaxID=619300 RepID=G3AV49_SPAPN|nr:uncharacterized protein SPAPADRAFT_68946 [Spathaspora passalidarum NRRL Y-27907]EGW30123.1 hypothetical protein SPAPADRAFT_68946 [Spathaspora passalidarum NRRL Y-27907]